MFKKNPKTQEQLDASLGGAAAINVKSTKTVTETTHLSIWNPRYMEDGKAAPSYHTINSEAEIEPKVKCECSCVIL